MTRPGFTIIEIIIVIAITVTIAALGIPALRTGQRNTELQSSGRALLSTIRLAQELAIGQQIKHVVKLITTGSPRYQLLKREINNNITTDTIIKEYTLTTGLTWGTFSGLTNNNEIEFNPTGAATNFGSVSLKNQNDKTITLTIKASGYVQIQ